MGPQLLPTLGLKTHIRSPADPLFSSLSSPPCAEVAVLILVFVCLVGSGSLVRRASAVKLMHLVTLALR